MHANSPTPPSYGYTAHLAGAPFDEARTRTIDALKNEGFAHAHNEAIDPRHDAAAGEAWLHGRFSDMLYPCPTESR